MPIISLYITQAPVYKLAHSNICLQNQTKLPKIYANQSKTSISTSSDFGVRKSSICSL